jgi:Mn-dependent DtxR family transcriptional regulator
MTSKARVLVLTESRAACLVALRHHQESKTGIAIRAKLDLGKTATALDELEGLGLAKRGEKNRWHTTGRGRTCRFKTVPDRTRRNSTMPGPGARRLLELLDRPMRGSELAERLGVSLQRVHQLVVKLHAQGRVRFGDPTRILQIVSRSGDKTSLLSHDEERVLSAIPDRYATNAIKIRLAVLLPEKQVQQILEALLLRGFIEALDGLAGDKVYRITAAGLEHPQRGASARRAQAPRLPVESDRVRAVLSVILDEGSLRIRDVRDVLKIPHDSINALMQYLKRKALVQKANQEFNAPYLLTDKGHEALAEMTRRHAA